MLNSNQIKKLQKNVGKKVDVQIQKRREEEKKVLLNHLIEMRKQIQNLQTNNPDRGNCVVQWEFKDYVLNEKTKKVTEIDLGDNDKKDLELIKQKNDKRYYFLNKEKIDYQHKVMKFMSTNYTTIRLALNQSRIEAISPHRDLSTALCLGTIFQEFQKEFPECSMLDFRDYFHGFEKFMMESLK